MYSLSFLGLLSILGLSTTHVTSAKAGPSQHQTFIDQSYWYDWGWYGGYPRNTYESFGAQSPLVNILKQDARCDDGYTFIEPRGTYVDTPGPVILDNSGNLVWMQTMWGQTMDLKVQHYQGKDYITFWRGTDSGTFGSGSYIMLDEAYQVFEEISPVGGLPGDLHEFRITEEGTALMTIYRKIEANMTRYGFDNGWIFDSLFQEVDIATGDLIFEWHASEHYDIHESLEPLAGMGRSPENAYDFFHINSVDKGIDGDYLISSRYMCAVICISHNDGSILWQLGGKRNTFTDMCDGAATEISWNHHAAWHSNSTLTVFDNGSNGRQKTATQSRGLLIDLDLRNMAATLLQEYVAPLKLLSPSQGSVQILPNGNVLVGWGHTPAFTEYTMNGKVLCDTHFGVIWFANMGWSKSYRTFKFPWIGRPHTLPDVAMRPKQDTLFVSWNGATEVDKWLLQSGQNTKDFKDHGAVSKKTFETGLQVPADAHEFVRVAALDRKGYVLAYSVAVSRYEKTTISLLEAPSRRWVPQPLAVLMLSLLGLFILLVVVFRLRFCLKRSVSKLLRKSMKPYQYQPLPSK